jgi:hypothetical protein
MFHPIPIGNIGFEGDTLTMYSASENIGGSFISFKGTVILAKALSFSKVSKTMSSYLSSLKAKPQVQHLIG